MFSLTEFEISRQIFSSYAHALCGNFHFMRQEFSTYVLRRGLKALKHREKNFNLCANPH